MTTAKLGYRTHHRQHWSEVWTRGTSTVDPCSYRYANRLLAESRFKQFTNVIQEGVLQKSTRGSLRSHLRASLARKKEKVQKWYNGHIGDWICSFVCARRARLCCTSWNLLEFGRKYTALTTKLLTLFFGLRRTNECGAVLIQKGHIYMTLMVANSCSIEIPRPLPPTRMVGRWSGGQHLI